VVNDDYDEFMDAARTDILAWLDYAPTEEMIQLLSKSMPNRLAFHRTLLAIRGLKLADVEAWR
jgi:antitoxin component HigA of HigAB toxin-antitoxin module